MFCSKCGEKINPNDTFCSNCGEIINKTSCQDVTSSKCYVAPTDMTDKKDATVAIIFTFFFGPLGLFYATVRGGITMTIAMFVVLMTATILFSDLEKMGETVAQCLAIIITLVMLAVWVFSMIWAWNAVKQHNNSLKI